MAANFNKNQVVDASFVLCFLMPDEYDFEVNLFFNQYKSGLINIISTTFLSFEVINGLKTALLRKRIDKNYALSRIREFLDYEIEVQIIDFTKTFLLASQYNLTIYDASYLHLAKLNRVPLLTLDEKLKRLT